MTSEGATITIAGHCITPCPTSTPEQEARLTAVFRAAAVQVIQSEVVPKMEELAVVIARRIIEGGLAPAAVAASFTRAGDAWTEDGANELQADLEAIASPEDLLSMYSATASLALAAADGATQLDAPSDN